MFINSEPLLLIVVLDSTTAKRIILTQVSTVCQYYFSCQYNASLHHVRVSTITYYKPIYIYIYIYIYTLKVYFVVILLEIDCDELYYMAY